MLDMSSCEIDHLLREAPIGRLSVADDHGQPYAIPLPFCWISSDLYLRVFLTAHHQ